MTEWQFLVVGAGLAFAGLVKGVTGMGLPLFATPVLATVFGARPAVVIVSIPVFLINTLLVYEGRRHIGVLRDIWPLAAAGALGVVVGLILLIRLDQNLLALLMAALVFLFLARGDRMVGDDPSARRLRFLAPLFGGVSGVLNGSTSIAAPLVAGYMYARRLPTAEFVMSMALVYEIFGAVQVLGLWRLGLYDAPVLTAAVLGLAPMTAAFVVGVRVRRRLDTVVFRRVVAALLALAALNLVLQGLRGLGVLG